MSLRRKRSQRKALQQGKQRYLRRTGLTATRCKVGGNFGIYQFSDERARPRCSPFFDDRILKIRIFSEIGVVGSNEMEVWSKE